MMHADWMITKHPEGDTKVVFGSLLNDNIDEMVGKISASVLTHGRNMVRIVTVTYDLQAKVKT